MIVFLIVRTQSQRSKSAFCVVLCQEICRCVNLRLYIHLSGQSVRRKYEASRTTLVLAYRDERVIEIEISRSFVQNRKFCKFIAVDQGNLIPGDGHS